MIKERSAREAEIVAAVGSLVTLPDVYLRVKRVFDNPLATAAEMGQAIVSDPALTARVLKLVNSAAFGLGVEVNTVSRAVTILGFQRLHDLVLASSLADLTARFPVPQLQSHWRVSVLAGLAASILARKCNILDKERLMLAGLLSDLGHLLLYQVAPAAASHAVAVSQSGGIPLYAAEKEIIGADYAGVGAALLEAWQLPDNLCVAVRYHIEPQRTVRHILETAVVHVANAIARHPGTPGTSEGEHALTVNPGVWSTLGLTPDILPELWQESLGQFSATARLIYPRARAA